MTRRRSALRRLRMRDRRLRWGRLFYFIMDTFGWLFLVIALFVLMHGPFY